VPFQEKEGGKERLERKSELFKRFFHSPPISDVRRLNLHSWERAMAIQKNLIEDDK
jgi:hypothetical protein